MIEPPYPADLEAKGWSLDLDYEKIEQSDTWAIASPEQRPWLLMLWLMAWRQVPVASLPDNDRLIAARIGMPVEQFSAWKDILLSGWELANDGRLYHKTLTQHALRMAEKRGKDRARVAAFRAKSAGQPSSNDEQDTSSNGVTRYTDATSKEVPRDQRVSSTPPTTHHPPTPEAKASPGKPAERAPSRFDEFWSEWPKSQRKVGKAACLEIWRRRKLDATADQIIAHVKAMKPTRQWLDGFEPAPKTYLNGSRWLDEIPEDRPPPPPRNDNWMTSNEGIDRMGREVGLTARMGESYRDFAKRISVTLSDRRVT